VSPLVLLAALTVGTRTYVDEFEPVAYDAQLQASIAAYVGPIRSVARILSETQGAERVAAARIVAAEWIERSRRRELRPLPPSDPEDSMREGVKAEILKSSEALASILFEAARDAAASGNFSLAAHDALHALEVSQVVKYSDLYSVGLVSLRQRQVLEFLYRLAEHLDATTAKVVLARLHSFANTERPLLTLVLRSKRNSARADSARSSANGNGEESVDSNQGLNLASLNGDSGTIQKTFEALSLSAEDGKLPSYLPEVRFAWSSQSQLERRKASLLNRLQSREAFQAPGQSRKRRRA